MPKASRVLSARTLAALLTVAGAGVAASSATAATCPADSTAVTGNVCEVQFTATGSTTWSAPAGVTKIEAVVVGGGGPGLQFDRGGAWPSKNGIGGGGGAVAIATLTGAHQVTVAIGGPAAASSVTPDTGAATTAQPGLVGTMDNAANSLTGGTSGTGKLGHSFFGSYGVGGGGASGTTTNPDGGAGVTISAAASAGSLFTGDARCFGGGGAGSNALWGIGGATATGGCGGGSATWNGSAYSIVLPTANSGGGGSAPHASSSGDWTGASGTVIIRFEMSSAPAAGPVAELVTPGKHVKKGHRVQLGYSIKLGKTGRYTFFLERPAKDGKSGKRVAFAKGSHFGTHVFKKHVTAYVYTNTKAGRTISVKALVGSAPKGSVLRVVLRNADGTLEGVSLPVS